MPSRRVGAHLVAGTRPVGRPTKITQVNRTREDGSAELIWEAIIAHMVATPFVEVAAAFVGVHKTTVYDWLKRGTHSRQLAEKTGAPVPKADQPFVDFSNATDRAIAEIQIRQESLVHQIARGGIRLETVTERYDGAGTLIDRTVKAETTAPDLKALTWILEHAFQGYYSSRARVEITGAEGGPVQVEHSTDAMYERIMAAVERSRVAAIDTTATEALDP